MLGYLCLIKLGNTLLQFIDSIVTFWGQQNLSLCLFSAILNCWTGFGLSISNQSNYLIEHLNTALVFIVFFSGYQF
jgi:hypothetical protein